MVTLVMMVVSGTVTGWFLYPPEACEPGALAVKDIPEGANTQSACYLAWISDFVG